MKTPLFLSFILMSICASYAQPNFTYADLPNIGDVGTYNHNPGYTPPGSLDTETGNNYTWDFSSLSFGQTFWAIDSFRVKTHPVSSNFPDATIEYYHLEAAGANLELYSYSNDTLYIHKIGSPISGQSFNPKIASIKFPITFNGMSQIVDTVFQGSYKTGVRTTEFLYDGFGTLNLPNGINHNNVFRVRKLESDSSLLTNAVVTYTNYIWYSQGGDAPLLRLSKTDFNGASGNIYSVYARQNGSTSVIDNETESNPDIILYPNPTNDIIQLKGIANDQAYTIYSIRGEEIKKGRVSDSNKIQLQGLPVGTYFLKVGEEKILQFVKK